ncbi:hypothetical protein AMS68_007693 [Peltaster fructicola]|uniref:DUF1996 domain-containing protein n=1 Tax=Peltaster fructicola TaxID=286661 RepID=A0A6H0Y5D2_9PEZI|nr:hypothetical protein AMS68_007693 [Peltaster fructicola]
MKMPSLFTQLCFVQSVFAFWRMPCRSQTGYGRLDPIMDPGEIADHVHAIHGGGNFGLTTTSADLTAPGSCTSCGVTQDHSAYWTPPLYFMYDNGTTVMVPQVGGMLAYYLQYLPNITAFPEGFQMVAGNRNLRHFDGPFPDTDLSSWPQDANDQYFLSQRALGFNCLNYNKTPEGSLYRHVMPTKEQLDNDCTDGLRLELAFPSCGTGAADSSNHKSHVAYPNLVKEGNCPPDYPVHYPFLFYETIWATNVFAGEAGQFVLSYGDPTGAGYHGDFLMGWESQEFLQNAVNTCTNLSGEVSDCPLFNLQSDADAAKCKFTMPDALKDDIPLGPRDGLPVSVPVQYGPANATAYPCAGRAGASAISIQYSAAPTTLSQGPIVTYSALDPAKTSTALGGIVVNMYHDDGNSGPAVPAISATSTAVAAAVKVQAVITSSAPPVVTQAPVPSSQSARQPNSIYTSDGQVVELFVDYTDVTVTATVTAAEAGSKHRRHLAKHVHHARP